MVFCKTITVNCIAATTTTVTVTIDTHNYIVTPPREVSIEAAAGSLGLSDGDPLSLGTLQ